MFLGTRAFLEIGKDGRFKSYEANDLNEWKVVDLTAKVCDI